MVDVFEQEIILCMQLVKSRVTEMALRASVEQCGGRICRCLILLLLYRYGILYVIYRLSKTASAKHIKSFPNLIPIEHRGYAAISSRNMGDRRESEGDPEAYSLTVSVSPPYRCTLSPFDKCQP